MRLFVYNLSVLMVLGLSLSGSEAHWGYRPKRLVCTEPVPQDLVDSPIEVIPERRRIVGECFADIDKCPVGSCLRKYKVTRYWRWWRRVVVVCPVYGVVRPITTSDTVDCGPAFGSREIERVTSCACAKEAGIDVNVFVVDSANDGTLLSGISVTVNDVQLTAEEVDGEFTTSVDSQTKQVIVSAVDSSGSFISTVKVVDVPVGSRGPFDVIVPLVKSAEPVSIDSTMTQTLSISENPSNPAVGVARFTIAPDVFRNGDGSPYSGSVLASVNFIDVSDPNTESQVPGQFLTRESGITSPLISDGIFALTFRDAAGNLLEVERVTVNVRDGMMLWTLGTDGLWEPLFGEPLPGAGGRKRRQTSLNQFTVNIQNAQWVNIDKIPGAPQCFFKARVFESDGSTEITTSTTTTFQTQSLGFITNVTPNQRLRLYAPSTRSPAGTCFSVRCPVLASNDTLKGFINMTSFETTVVGGVNVPVVQSLTPKVLAQYSDFQDALDALRYERAANGLDIFVNFISNSTGPFYTDRSVCETSSITEPAFHFIKPPVPSYEPIPDDTDLCTARLGFYFDQFVNETFFNLSLPNVTAVSVWSDNGTDFFHTDNVIIDVATLPSNATYLSVCVEYRCSEAGSPTTVYLTVNSPNVTVPANPFGEFDDNSGAFDPTSNETVTVPALSCSGNCPGNLCRAGGFNSSFLAQPAMAGGPDFYLGTRNNCTQETNQEQFASILYCYTKTTRQSREDLAFK